MWLAALPALTAYAAGLASHGAGDGLFALLRFFADNDFFDDTSALLRDRLLAFSGDVCLNAMSASPSSTLAATDLTPVVERRSSQSAASLHLRDSA